MATAVRRGKKSSKSRRAEMRRDFFGKLTGDSRKGDMSLSFFAYVMILIVVGLVMMSSASYAWAYAEHGGDGLYYAKNQAKNVVIGLVAMFVFSKIDYHNFARLPFKKLKKIDEYCIITNNKFIC